MLGWLGGRTAGLDSAREGALAAPDAKMSRTGALVALHSAGRPAWTARNYAALVRAGYMRNPVVYRAVRLVAEAAASVRWLVHDGPAELDAHPLLDLLSGPIRASAAPS